ncbi:glycosyltransferase [Roseospira visakhapatnamensis]|uniref:GT2 family glycosyltransferase n=1 Tax=Roseospira visakhapatnamensis TaxID=390880 RepID=A0A7W6RE78_9PROT|nr:GT2 family glycosyltransferase [Roseospira visakhapatnamensis]
MAPSNPDPEVSVLVVSHDSAALATRALDHLAAQTWTAFEVVVVENGPGGAAWARAQAATRPFPVTVLEPGHNLGFAAGNNLAARHARGRWLALLNPDAFPEPGWLAALMAAARRFPSGTAFGSVQVDAADPARLDGIGDCWCPAGLAWRGGYKGDRATLAPATDLGVFGPCAAAALWARTDFEALGGFEDRFFCYGEDVDLALRHRLRGGCCVTVAAAIVRHLGSGTTSRHGAFGIYHDRRNMLWVFTRTTPTAWLLPLLPLHALGHLAMLARAARHGAAGAAWRGLRDGLAGLWGPTGVLAQRRAIQRTRRVPLGTLARALTWNPARLLTRAPKHWPPASEGTAHD